MTEAGPLPVFGLLYQAASYRVAVDVLEFFYSFGCGEDIEVVVTGLPEWALFVL